MCAGHAGPIHESTCLCQKTSGRRKAEKLVQGVAANLQSAVVQIYSLVLMLLAASQPLPWCDREAFPGVGLKKRWDWWRGCGVGWVPGAARWWEQRAPAVCALPEIRASAEGFSSSAVKGGGEKNQ